MCRPKSVSYTFACGHYLLEHWEADAPPDACAKAVRHPVGKWGAFEWSPCAALICELEAQQSGDWQWVATVDGVTISVEGCSSGHCNAWREKEYKKPNYKALAKSEAEAVKKDVKSEGASSTSSTAVESR
jgi:hypothetical protein